MAKTITIEPITRVEGHGKITLKLDNKGKVDDAKLHITQYRGFEKFCEGRPFPEMPSLTARACGICPVSHLLASSKACDAILAVSIPPTADKLRRLLNYAQFTQSHALSFFHLSSPDMLLGMDADPAIRNVVGVIREHTDLAVMGVTLRKIGQQIISILAGKRIHPAWTVPGGVNNPLTKDSRDEIAKMVPEALDLITKALSWFKGVAGNFADEVENFGNFNSLYLGLVTETGGLDFYGGKLRMKDAKGNIIEDQVEADDYQTVVGEAVESYSYMKFPYYVKQGYPTGLYRVGPLARLNVADHAGTPLADEALAEFKAMSDGPVTSSFHFHYARLIEILFSVESMQLLIDDPDILDPHVRSRARSNRSEGVGITEAPRGTLFHHYKIDEDGQMVSANMIVATGNNNLAMNKSILQVAQAYVNGNKLQEGMLNRVEAVIRCYDPCLSCATHAAGKMPLHIQLTDTAGNVVDEVLRD